MTEQSEERYLRYEHRHPNWVLDALASTETTDWSPCDKSSLERGDIREIQFADGKTSGRLGVVFSVHPIDDDNPSQLAARVALISSRSGMATEWDYIAFPSETEIHDVDEILIECDIVGPVWESQLGECCGHVRDDLLQRLDETCMNLVLGSKPRKHEPEFGVRVFGEPDPRIEWKNRERDTLDSLSKDCRLALWT